MTESRMVEKNRIVALTDGVYAIAMTLAVLSIDVSAIQPPTEETLGASIGILVDQLRHYVISFLTLGAFWVGQHLQFEKLKTVDMKMVWITLFHLMFITLIPFTTSLACRSSMGISSPVGSERSTVDVGTHGKKGMPLACATTPSLYVPILLATSPLAATRSAPTNTIST